MLIGMIGMGTPNDQLVYVEGKLLSQNCASYEVYAVEDGIGILIQKGNCKNKYSVKLILGIQYVIKFTSKEDNTIKYLIVDLEHEGTYLVNVDFKNCDSAILEFDGEAYHISNVDPKTFVNI